MRRSGYRWLVGSGLGAVLLLGAAGVRADVLTLQNDSFEDGGEATFQGGFVTGEMGAVTLGPVAETFQIRKVQFLFGPTDSQRTITLRVFSDTGDAAPGNELYNGEYQVTPSSEGMQEINLAADDLVHNGAGSIRVAVEFQHDNFPGIANDSDGITSGVNWINAEGFGWVGAGSLGVSGDFIIRAEVATGSDIGGGTGGSGTGGSGTGGSGTGGSGTGGSASGAGGPMVCIPGDTQPCVGPGACQGGQSCLADGSGYGACECGPAQATPATAEEDGGCTMRSQEGRSSAPAAWLAGIALCGALRLARRRRSMR